jgi:cytochrome d ubiquinol oxidase subunit II
MTLATIWFCLCAISLGLFVVLDGFDLGAGAASLWLARNRQEHEEILDAVGPFWDGNEVWLVAGAAALFLAFPQALGLGLSGFYLPMMFVLWLLMLRALGIEAQHLWHHSLWLRAWEKIFGLASLLLVVLLGFAVGNLLRGFDFAPDGTFSVPLWTSFLPVAPVGIIDAYTLPIAAFATTLLLAHGLHWIAMRCDTSLGIRAAVAATSLTAIGLVLFVGLSIFTMMIPNGLADRIAQAPWGALFPLTLVAAAVATLVMARRKRAKLAFAGSCLQICAALAAAAFRLYPEILPGLAAGEGLAIESAASSDAALAFGLWWWLPGFGLALTYFRWMYAKMLKSVM